MAETTLPHYLLRNAREFSHQVAMREKGKRHLAAVDLAPIPRRGARLGSWDSSRWDSSAATSWPS